MTSSWFPGAGRTGDEEMFLAELRSCAEGSGLVDASPADTGLLTWNGTLVVTVELPGLRGPRATPTLEVLAHLRGDESSMSSG